MNLRVLALLLCGFATACATPIELPSDFVEVDDYAGFTAVTADEARLQVRELHDSSEAALAFWIEAVRHDFVDQRGYQLIDEGEVNDRAGTPGHWFQCAANVGGERVGYLLAVWADGAFWSGTDLFVVEFAAREEVFAARLQAVRDALKTVRR